MTDHADEAGQPCTRHAASRDKLLDYALLGARASGFHHDAASKLQSLMMALDEINELIGEDSSELRTATETAQTSLRELHQLLTANRALAKPPQRREMPLRDLLKAAADRTGVRLSGEYGGPNVNVAQPACTQAFAMLLDLIAGSVQSARTVEVHVEQGEHVSIRLVGSAEPTHASANEQIEIAAHVIEREQGSLRCAPKSFVVQLPSA